LHIAAGIGKIAGKKGMKNSNPAAIRIFFNSIFINGA